MENSSAEHLPGLSRVAVIPCPSYDRERVREAVALGLNCLGGLGSMVSPEEKILLKPNLLKKAAPELAVTTHPAVFAAVAEELKKLGCQRISYGDSPGIQAFEDAAKAAGIWQEAERLSLTPGNFREAVILPYPQGRAAREFTVCKAVTEADCLISISKMKTHALERVTGAVKNLYGCVQGAHKGAGHVSYPSAHRFASMLCDLHGAVKPRLHIMDGIVAMEGNGPSSGTPAEMGVLLFSRDAVALDTVFCRLIGLEPSVVPTNFCGQQYGLGTMEEEKIQVITVDETTGQPFAITMEEAAARWGRPDFQVDRAPHSEKRQWKLLRRLTRPFQQRPQIDAGLCVACGICVESCPVEGKAISFRNGKGQPPVYDYSRCIRCYCCQEMCPKKAISVKRSRFSRKKS